MSHFSNYLEEKIVESSLRGGTWPTISNIYIALFTADPGETGAANEVNPAGTWTNYARIDAAVGGAIASGWSASADGVTSNAKTITFAANNGAADVTVTHIGIFDASTGGNMLYYAPLASSKTLKQGDVLSFGIGAITITVA